MLYGFAFAFSSNIPGRLRQSPAQLAEELKSIPVDCDVGTPPQWRYIRPLMRVQHRPTCYRPRCRVIMIIFITAKIYVNLCLGLFVCP